MTSLNKSTRDIFIGFIYFVLSTLFTWWFVVLSPLYISKEQMLLSTAVAGGKWGIQILLALLFLQQKKWLFIKYIGFVCFIGSCILLPYVVSSSLSIVNDASFFIASLIVSVLVMIVLYFKAVIKTGIAFKWWLFWLLCLATAITLQLTVVFDYI